jgi:hypothetical protein
LGAYAMVLADHVMDVMYLHSHHVHLQMDWGSTLLICVSLFSFLRALWKRGIVRIGHELQDYSLLYFSVALTFLVVSQVQHRSIVEAVYVMKHAITP